MRQTMQTHKPHPILQAPHTYELVDFHFHVDKNDPAQSFIDMTLVNDADAVTLRFWQPVNLKIEERFPYPTGGMVFYDVSADGLENIGVEVSDFEASSGAITFSAKSVERISGITP
jgi:hypothetical protein